MGLTNRKEEQLRKQPIIESYVRKSEDGKFIITKMVFTHIRPTVYYEKVIANDLEQEEDELEV